MASNATGLIPLGRVMKACDRCHKQKLKCDPFRPCTLCTRSNIVCVTSPPRNGAGTKRRRSQVAEISQLTPRNDPNTPVREILRRSEPGPPHIPNTMTPTTTASSVDDQDFGTTASSIEFARSVFGREGGGNLTRTSLIPGHAACDSSNDQPWALQTMRFPPEEIMQATINKYFDAYHWYICLFNEHTFRQRANQLLQTPCCWQRKDMNDVVAMLAVALLGLQAGLADDSWSAKSLFLARNIDPAKLLREISSEIRRHIVDVVEDCKLEAVQICLLFATFHVYHDSPNLGWVLTSMAVSAAYALGIQSTKATVDDPSLQQIRSRCWNHILVADTFALIVYGRPGLIDSTLASVHELSELEDTILDPSILNHPLYGQEFCPKTVTFHMLKAKLYRIIRHALDRFRVLQHSHQDSERGIEATIEAVRDIQGLLTQFRSKFPPLFEWENWKHSDPWKHAEDTLAAGQDRNPWRRLLLQATMIQVLYNGAVILTHRPLLEYKISSLGQSKPSHLVLESLRYSLDAAVKSALCISQTPIQRLDGQFCISFFFMHLFTAGVILCMAPASQPLSPMSQQAKAGIVRIIRASRDVGSKNRIAQHTEKLLSELLKITIQREMDNALKAETDSDIPDEALGRGPEVYSREAFRGIRADMSMLPMEGDQHKQSHDASPAHHQHVQRSYDSSHFQIQDPVDLALPGDTFLDIGAGQFSNHGFPNNMWPFRGYADMNVNVGGFDEMMFNLLPSEGHNLPNSGYGFDN